MPPESTNEQSFLQRNALPLGWIVSSLIWAAVMIDTGEIGWPLAVWMATTFAPLSLLASRERAAKLRGDHTSAAPDGGPDVEGN